MTTLRCAGLSDIGTERQNNEDRLLIDDEHGLFIVADGLGGKPGGAFAAEIVVELLPTLLSNRLVGDINLADGRTVEAVADALVELSGLVRVGAEQRAGLTGMGSTVVLALVRDRHALVAHLGDSRAYLLRRRRLQRLTDDHTLGEALIAAGALSPEQARTHIARGSLTRYAGMDGEPLPETTPLALRPGDRLLLTSDGLTGVVDDPQLAALLAEQRTPADTCHALIAAATAADGHDNITTIVIDIDTPT